MHVLDVLLKRGHSVVATVRSQAKADKIREVYANVPEKTLSFALVEDIAKEGAFDKAVVSDPPFEAVVHTASPFHFKATDIQKELLDPAIIGTTGILKSIRANAPSVKKVVITSSFASIVDGSKGDWPEHTYSEEDWSPLTKEQALENANNGYRASKKFAEEAAWNFIKEQKPNFTLATMCPPLVLGPIEPLLQNDVKSLNTSNERIAEFLQGKHKGEFPAQPVRLWIDVRDLADAHVAAMEKSEADNKRFLLVGGYFNSRVTVEALLKHFPDYKDKLPSLDLPGGDYPEGGVYKYDVSRAEKILGIKWKSLEQSLKDTAESLQEIGC